MKLTEEQKRFMMHQISCLNNITGRLIDMINHNDDAKSKIDMEKLVKDLDHVSIDCKKFYHDAFKGWCSVQVNGKTIGVTDSGCRTDVTRVNVCPYCGSRDVENNITRAASDANNKRCNQCNSTFHVK